MLCLELYPESRPRFPEKVAFVPCRRYSHSYRCPSGKGCRTKSQRVFVKIGLILALRG